MFTSDALVCSGITVCRADRVVLTDIDFTLKSGQLLALLGGNGAGKTTLLEALAGLIPVNEGTIQLAKESLVDLPCHKRAQRGIRLVRDRGLLFPTLTVAENIELARAQFPDRSFEINGIYPPLKTKYKQRAGSLSGGETRIISTIIALFLRPRVLLIDEFTEGLQRNITLRLLGCLRKFCLEGGIGMLVVHSPQFAEEEGLPCLRLENGRLIHQ